MRLLLSLKLALLFFVFYLESKRLRGLLLPLSLIIVLIFLGSLLHYVLLVTKMIMMIMMVQLDLNIVFMLY